MTTATSSPQNTDRQAAQLDLEGNAIMVKATSRQKKRQAEALRLTHRDLLLLDALLDYGGCLSTVDVSTRFWPPRPAQRLAGWGIDSEQIQAWLDQHSHSDLIDAVEQLKWGRKLNRLRQAQQLTKAEGRLVAWLNSLDAEVQEELVEWLDVLLETSPAQWLSQTIIRDRQAPQAYQLRERWPHEAVSSACKSRLRYLANQGLIEPQEQATRLSEGRAMAVWFLTRSGRNLLAQVRGVRPNQLDWKPVGSYGHYHLTHRLCINRFRLAVELACQQMGYEILRWIDDNQLKRLLGKEKVILMRRVRDAQTGHETDVEEEHRLKIPDGYFWIEMGSAGQRHCFFELDNHSLTLRYSEPNPKDYAAKVRTLAAFYRSGRYHALFPEAGDSMWLLTVTTGSQQRMTNLKQTAENVLGQNRAADRYWFACMDDIPTWQQPFSTAVFESIWQRAGQERWWRLDETV